MSSKPWCDLCNKKASASHWTTDDHRDAVCRALKLNGQDPPWPLSDKEKRRHLQFWSGSSCRAAACTWCRGVAQ